MGVILQSYMEKRITYKKNAKIIFDNHFLYIIFIFSLTQLMIHAKEVENMSHSLHVQSCSSMTKCD